MPRLPSPQRVRAMGAELNARGSAAVRTIGKTTRVIAANARASGRDRIQCTEIDADGIERVRTFTVHKQIGEGAYSNVFKVREWPPDGRQEVYAMKRILAQDAEARRRLVGEIELMRRLPPHPNVLNLIALHQAETGVGLAAHLLLEMCRAGSVVDYLLARGGEPFGLPQVYRLYLDMAQALLHLHSQHPPIAHRDFKLENMLLASDGFAKLCDFGSATCRAQRYVGKAAIDEANDEIHRMCTAQYRSPEQFELERGHLVNEKVDVWALGIAFFKLLCNRDALPPGEEKLGALNATWRQRLPEARGGGGYGGGYGGAPAGSLGQQRAPDPVGRALLELMLRQDPAERPSIAQLLQWLRAQALPPGVPATSSAAEFYRPGRLWVQLRGARNLLCKGGVAQQPHCYARVVCEGKARQTGTAPSTEPRWRARFAFMSHSLARVRVDIWQAHGRPLADEFLGQLSVQVHRQLLAQQGGDEAASWHLLERRTDKSRVAGSCALWLEFEPLSAHRADWAAWSDAIDGKPGGAPGGPRAEAAGGREPLPDARPAGSAGGAPPARAYQPAAAADGGGSFWAAGGDEGSGARSPAPARAPSPDLLGGGGVGSADGAQAEGENGLAPRGAGERPSPSRALPAANGRRPVVADHSLAIGGATAQRPPSPELMGGASADFDPFGLAALEAEDEEDGERDLLQWEATEWGGAMQTQQPAAQPGSGAGGALLWGQQPQPQQTPSLSLAGGGSGLFGGSSLLGGSGLGGGSGLVGGSGLGGGSGLVGGSGLGGGFAAEEQRRPYAGQPTPPLLDSWGLVADPLASPPALPPSLHEQEQEEAQRMQAAGSALSHGSGGHPDLLGGGGGGPSGLADLLGEADLLCSMDVLPQPEPARDARGQQAAHAAQRRSVQDAMLDAFAPPMLFTQPQPQQMQPQQMQPQPQPQHGVLSAAAMGLPPAQPARSGFGLDTAVGPWNGGMVVMPPLPTGGLLMPQRTAEQALPLHTQPLAQAHAQRPPAPAAAPARGPGKFWDNLAI